MRLVWIGLAGALGALARHGVTGLFAERARGAFPWGTFVVNVTGCFVLGLLFTVLTERFVQAPDLRAAITVGFLGAYTTFSTFALESLTLADEGALLLAATNLAGSVAAGVAAVAVGVWIGRGLGPV